jgi:DNA-binding FadR family transcriptional regulator
MKTNFTNAPRVRLYEYVSDEIERAIREKEILPGEKLPSENSLADQFNVSRTIIREAFKILTERKLISVEDGRGAFVLSPNSDESTEALSRYIARLDIKESHERLFEMRLMIEPELCHLAAERINKQQIKELQDVMETLQVSIEDPDQWIDADLAFHKLIAKISRNPYALVFIETLLDHMDFLVGSGFLLEGAIDATISSHLEILSAIKNRQSDQARQAMREHILQSRERLEEALEKIQDD